MVRLLRYPAVAKVVCRHQPAGWVLVAVMIFCGATQPLAAQAPKIHYRHSGDLPPGAIGRSQLQRGGPLPGYFQPIQVTAPEGTKVSLAVGGTFDPTQDTPRTVGCLIGQVYRLKVTHIPLNPGREVFPSIEVIDRLYPPLGKETEFPIPVQLTEEDLRVALSGRMVMRVIYLENPDDALPIREVDGFQNWFEAGTGDDPLHVADTLGRPVAILRMGARIPDRNGPDGAFLYGSPPFQHYEAVTDGEVKISDSPDSSLFPVDPTAPNDPATRPPQAMPLAPASYPNEFYDHEIDDEALPAPTAPDPSEFSK